jgi:hypothetical protein
VLSKTASYTVVSADNGKLITFSGSASPILTLPSTVPANGWYIDVQNAGTGVLTFNLSSHNLDGASTGPDIDPRLGIRIFSDGSNYFTQRGMGQEFYNNSGTFQANTRIVTGRATFSAGTSVTVNFSGEAAFTSNTSFQCTVTTTVNPPTAQHFGVTYTSTSITINASTSTSETVAYICIGN